MVFEIPTGVVADSAGRRASYLLGAGTLVVSTLVYLFAWHIHGPFWLFAVASVVLGLGFTFFSGATEAWLVDALQATGYDQPLEAAFAKGQIAGGVAMLTGTLAGGLIAQATNLGVPYVMRVFALALTFGVAAVLMKDVGFTPQRGTSVLKRVRSIARASFDEGLRRPAIRWMMLTSPFGMGVAVYAFYAMQPFLLDLYSRHDSYAIAGLAASIVAGAQIAGGLLVPVIRKLFTRRTTLLAAGALGSVTALLVTGLVPRFALVIAMLVVWALLFAATRPVRQAYLNALIPSAQRATVLSADNFLSSAGGVVFQPSLARIADAHGFPLSYVASAGLQLLMIPFLALARRQQSPADRVGVERVTPDPSSAP
jgi:MFS family permease